MDFTYGVQIFGFGKMIYKFNEGVYVNTAFWAAVISFTRWWQVQQLDDDDRIEAIWMPEDLKTIYMKFLNKDEI